MLHMYILIQPRKEKKTFCTFFCLLSKIYSNAWQGEESYKNKTTEKCPVSDNNSQPRVYQTHNKSVPPAVYETHLPLQLFLLLRFISYREDLRWKLRAIKGEQKLVKSNKNSRSSAEQLTRNSLAIRRPAWGRQVAESSRLPPYSSSMKPNVFWWK